MTTKNSKSLLESISNVLAETGRSELLKFILEFDDDLRTNVGDWMKDLNTIEKLMRLAKTNSYDFKEIVLPSSDAVNMNSVISTQRGKGYKLFDSGTIPGPSGKRGLLFYKSVPLGAVKRLYTNNRFAKAVGKDFKDRLGKTTLGKAINSVLGVFKDEK